MQTAFDMTVEWAFDRYSFGRPLASYQELKHRFADMKTWLEASHAISDAAAAAVAAGSPDAAELVSAAKAYIGDYGVRAHAGLRPDARRHRRDLRARPAPLPAAPHRRPRAVRHPGRSPAAHRRHRRAQEAQHERRPRRRPSIEDVEAFRQRARTWIRGQPRAGRARRRWSACCATTAPTRRSSQASPATASSSACSSTPASPASASPRPTAARA